MPFPILRRFHRFLALAVFVAVALYIFGVNLGYKPPSSWQDFTKQFDAGDRKTSKHKTSTHGPSRDSVEQQLIEQAATGSPSLGLLFDEQPPPAIIYDNSLKHGNREFESTYRGIPNEVEGRDGVPQRDREIPDPEGWRRLPIENGFYLKNGIKAPTQQSRPGATRVYLPYPAYSSDQWKSSWKGIFHTCVGPNGELLNKSDGSISYQYAYRGIPEKFPQPISGSFEALGLDNVCFDRVMRYGIYGLDQDSLNLHEREKPLTMPIQWDNVDWGSLQNECLRRNRERFSYHGRVQSDMTPSAEMSKEEESIPPQDGRHGEIRKREFVPTTSDTYAVSYRSRTAVLIRVWEGYNYTPNDLITIRAMITELSLRSGGEYQVFLFVNVKDRNAKIFESRKAHDDMLRKAVPKELRSIAILWNEDIFPSWYPKIGDYQVYWHQFMSVQWFSLTHPEFDFIWNWETDMRYTGNHFHFLSKIDEFAQKQPRKYLWERNARFYLPAAHGNNYTKFVEDTNTIIKDASDNGSIPTPIWGPKPYSPIQKPLGPEPPHPNSPAAEKWGVDEDADLVTLLPIWDPRHVDWDYKHKMWNVVPGEHPIFDDAHGPTDVNFDHPDFDKIDRRVVINTALRLSKRLLRAMHEENLAGRDMQAEMFPATVALHHGFKAVYAPHPIWSQHRFPASQIDGIFNANGGVPGRWGQEWDSIYSQNIEKNFMAWSWYYWGELGRALYRRWMGWRALDGMGDIGGRWWEERGAFLEAWGGGFGRMCLPGMLLHPVKTRDLWEN